MTRTRRIRHEDNMENRFSSGLLIVSSSISTPSAIVL
jgi:hypothetical protein